MGFLDKLGFGKKNTAEPAEPQAPAIDPTTMMQEHVNPALIAILSSVVEDQETDKISGSIALDSAMRITGIRDLTCNGNPVVADPAAIEEANGHLAPLAQLPENMRFNAIDFGFDAGVVEMNLGYPE
ncbi:hypothetical protein QVA66_03345 [Staphylococcus chromogenes]|nr:hypothetical protein [Staphylococcus chromogenes]